MLRPAKITALRPALRYPAPTAWVLAAPEIITVEAV